MSSADQLNYVVHTRGKWCSVFMDQTLKRWWFNRFTLQICYNRRRVNWVVQSSYTHMNANTPITIDINISILSLRLRKSRIHVNHFECVYENIGKYTNIQVKPSQLYCTITICQWADCWAVVYGVQQHIHNISLIRSLFSFFRIIYHCVDSCVTILCYMMMNAIWSPLELWLTNLLQKLQHVSFTLVHTNHLMLLFCFFGSIWTICHRSHTHTHLYSNLKMR